MTVGKKRFMLVSELARRANVSIHTVHHYRKKGLLSPPIKTGQTMAYYNDIHLEEIRRIKKLQKEENVPLVFMKERLASLGAEAEEGQGTEGLAGRKVYAEWPRRAPSRRRRPRAEMDESRRKSIINTARERFSRKGYHRTKISDITEALKMGKGTFYLYFPNKRELFFSVIDDIIERLLQDNDRAIGDEENIPRRLQIRVESFLKTYRTAQQMIHLLRGEAVSEDQEPEEKIREIYEKLAEPVKEDLKKGVEQGLFRPMRMDLLSYIGVSLVESLSYWLATHDDLSDEEAMEILGEFFLDGIRARPGQKSSIGLFQESRETPSSAEGGPLP